MKRVVIFGTSGHAREVGDIVDALGYCAVYAARTEVELAEWSLPEECILESAVHRYSDMMFAIGIGENRARQIVANRFADTLRFANLIHPSASFGKRQRESLEAKQGIVICAGVRLSNNITVGNFSVLNRNATVGHDVIIDDFVNIAPGASISGNVHLGTRSWIGTGAVVNQGKPAEKLHIGADTMIGSGSVVVKTCDPDSVYVGVPAKRIR